MAFSFCPNLSHPENKKRIQEIGIEKFYQEYYEKNFTQDLFDELESQIKTLSNKDKVYIYASDILGRKILRNSKEYGNPYLRQYPEGEAKYISGDTNIKLDVFEYLGFLYANKESFDREKQYNTLLNILKVLHPELDENQIKANSNLAYVWKEAEFDYNSDNHDEFMSNAYAGKITNYSFPKFEGVSNNSELKRYLDRAPFKDVDYNTPEKLYDISPQNNPNFTVMDKLFVDIDKFSDSQQNEVVESIIYQLEEGKKEGLTNVDDLFNYAREVFSNTREEVEGLEEEEWKPFIQKLSDIDDNWDKFRDKVTERLNGIGIKVTRVIEDSEPQESQEVSDTPDLVVAESSEAEDNFVSSEGTFDRSGYDDQFNFSRSSKDTASGHLKLKLSLIPEVEYIDGNLEPKTNFLNSPKFMSLDKVWVTLQRELTGLNQDQIIPRLDELSKDNLMFAEVLNQITSDSNTNIQNEFIVTFSKQQAKFDTVKIGYKDKSGARTIKVFGTNRQGAEDIISDDWYDSFKDSKFVNSVNGEYIVNTEFAKLASKSLNNLITNFNPSDKGHLRNLKSGLKITGIDISLTALENLAKRGIRIDGAKYSAKEFLDKYVRIIFSRLAGEQSETEISDNKLDQNNPFISEGNTIQALAKLELNANPFLYEGSFISGDNKAKYSYVNNSYISRFFNKLSNNEDRGEALIRDILSTSYASTSIWGNKYLNNPTFRDNFSLSYFDTTGTDESNITNKTFNKMSTKEKELTRISLYQNQGRNGAKFMGLIPSDKTTLPLITAPRIPIILNETGQVTNKEGKNALYTPFIAEYNRILQVQKQQKDPSVEKIDGYHNGMGEKFLIYDFFNGNTELFDSNGQLKVVDSQTLKGIITPLIEKFTKDLIRNQIKYWNSLGINEEGVFFDKTAKSKLGKFADDKQYKIVLAANYAINNFLANFNYTQLISGDPALHGKKTIDLTWINYSKRLAKDIAPGLDGVFDKPTFKTIFLKDIKVDSKHLNEYLEVLGEKAKAYEGMNIADAQEYTTLKEHLAVMEAYGKLTPELKEAGDRLLKGGDSIEDINLILQPMKPVYVGTKVDNELGINRMYYIKTSSFPLIPALTKGLEIDKLRAFMETKEIDRAVYESGVKLGLTNSTQSIQNEDGEFNSNLLDKSVELSRDGFRIQQEIPFHGDHSEINEGSQGRKLILVDVDDDQNLELFGHNITGKAAKQLYENLHIEKMNRAMSKLIKDIGAEVNPSGKLGIRDLSKLQQVLIEEATSRNYNINDIYGLQIDVDPETGRQSFRIPLAFNNSSNRLESIMNALFTNRVIKQELPGFTKVQGSSAGFSKLSTLDNLNAQTRDSIIWLDPKDTTLNYIRKDNVIKANTDVTKEGDKGSKDKGKLLQADILVPSWFKDENDNLINIKNFLSEDGYLDTKRLPEELLTVIGIRIPTQGANSMMSFKVKGFLPRIVGDLAVVPAEIVAQMGSDFDVDKLFVYRYHYKYDGNKLSKIKANISVDTTETENGLQSKVNANVSKMSDEQIDNSIIQFYEDRYKDPDMLGKILEPNGFGKLPDLAKEIADIMKLNSNQHFLTNQAQNTIHKNNNDGKAGTGIFSLFSTFIRAAQDAKLELEDGVVFRDGDRVFESKLLYGKGLTSIDSPSAVVSYLQSASVDNAKEQLLGILNINSMTMDVAGVIALTGYDERYIAYFLSQPIIREYVERMSNITDITNTDYNPRKADEVLDSLAGIKDAKKSFLERSIGLDNAVSVEDLKNELSNPTNQLAILHNFIRIKELAKQIRMVQSAINTDTSGLGVRFVDLQVKADQINLVKDSGSIKNVDLLFENTTTAKAAEIVEKALEVYSQILPYNSPTYRETTNTILELAGKAGEEVSADSLSTIYKSIKSFLYSNESLLDLNNVNTERQALLYGSQALGNRWEEYRNSPAGKKNMLVERIKVRRGVTVDEPIRLEAINTPAANNSDNNQAMQAFYRMYYKGTTIEKALANDLIKYYLLTGGQQGPNSISRYIPYDVLEEHNFSKKLNAINNSLNSGENILANVIEQYFQHNPSSAITFDSKSNEILNGDINGFKINRGSSFEIPTFNDYGQKTYTYPTYMSNYNREIKGFTLYKIKEVSSQQATYSRIDTLDHPYILQYNATADKQYSLFTKNQSRLEIPDDVNKPVTKQTDDTPTEKTDKTVVPIDKEYLTSKLNLDNKNLETTLDTIISNPETEEFGNIAKDLKQIISSYPNITIEDGELDGRNGEYHNSTIKIDLGRILRNSKDSLKESQRVILHETLHAITASKIENYDKLNDSDKKKVDKLKILYNQYRRVVDTEELAKYESLLEKYKNPLTRSRLNQTSIEFLKANKSKYYALTSLHEFIAAGLTDDYFTEELKKNNFWTKLWDAISNLLGLSKENSSDYDALYSTTLDLGTNSNTDIETSQEDFSPEFTTPRDQKIEFLSKYHKKDGQEISLASFNQINASVKANSKYDKIRLDAPYENGKRVLRVYTKGGTPLYDIAPEGKEKTKEELFVAAALKRLYSLRSKFMKSVGYDNNVALQAKVADIDNRIEKIKTENTAAIIISDAINRLDIIENRLNQPDLMNVHDVLESEKYLTFYKDIREFINYNEAFEEENKNLDTISRRAQELIIQLKAKKKELLVTYIQSRLNIKTDLNQLLSSPTFDVGKLESYLQSGAFSSSQLIQLMQEIVEDSQLRTNEDFTEVEESYKGVIEDFLKKHKNYDFLLQKDKDGKSTGRLLNKYSQEYYDELAKLKGKPKEYSKFYKSNTKIELTDEGKEAFEKDLNEIKSIYPEWNVEGTHDLAAYTQWFATHDPYSFIADYKKGIYRNKDNYKNYIQIRPIDKWLDQNYVNLKKLPEDSVERQLYNILDSEFRQLGKKYGNQVNYIPEVSKDLMTYMLQGNIKGGFHNIKSSMIDSLYSSVEPKYNSADTDINGVPHDIIPVYGMDDLMNPEQKSYDLGRVLLTVKAQEAALKHKGEVEPYLIMMKELLQDLPQYVTNMSGEQQIDENGNPVLDTSITRNQNLNEQAKWIIEDYLYNKGTKKSNYFKNSTITQTNKNSKGEDITTTKVLTGSKIVDSLSTLTRVKGMGLNIFSGVGNVLYGMISNAVASGDRKSFGEAESIQALGIMLNAVVPGTATKTKVAKLMKTFDVLVQTNEIKYGQFDLKSTENPLKNLSVYEFQKRGEYFVQGQTAMAMLLSKKVKALDGKEYKLFDAFNDKGEWNTEKFGENPYKNRDTKRALIKEIRDTVSSIHGDYARGLRAKEHYIGRALLVFRTWLPQSIAVRFGKEYTDLQGNVRKGRYRSYKAAHLALLPLIRDAYAAFTVDKSEDNIDMRNLRQNMIELSFIPILWAVGLMLKSMIKSGDDDEDKALLTFILNSMTRAQGDLTFFFNPYSFQSTIREPIPAFKTLMDIGDIFPAVITAMEGNDTYKTGIHKGQSKVYTKIKKAIPLVNQPDKLISSTKSILGEK